MMELIPTIFVNIVMIGEYLWCFKQSVGWLFEKHDFLEQVHSIYVCFLLCPSPNHTNMTPHGLIRSFDQQFPFDKMCLTFFIVELLKLGAPMTHRVIN